MNIYISTLCYAILLLISSCHPSDEYPEKMLQAEQCMDTYPDSGFILLNSLQATIHQEPEKTQMYYHLLMLKGGYKCHLPCNPDSLITVVIDYYKKNNNQDKLMEAYYLKGRIYDKLPNMLQAFECYQKALQQSKGSKQYKILALIHNQIGNVYLYQDMEKEAIPMFQNAYRYFEKAKASTKLQYPIRNIARAYSELGDEESAIHYYKEAYRLSKNNKDKAAENTILNELGRYYIRKKEYSLAIKSLRASNADYSDSKSTYYLNWALIHQHANNPDSARYFFQKSIETQESIHTTADAYLYLAEIEEEKGHYKEAFRLLRNHQQWKDSIIKIMSAETAQRVHSLHNDQRTETENQKLGKENVQKNIWLYQIVVFVAIVSIIAGASYRLYKKQKRQQQMIKTQVKPLEAMYNQICSQREEREVKIKALRKSDIYIRFHTGGLEGKSLEEQEWIALQQVIDETYDNFTGQLYTLCHKLSSIELRICYLMKISVNVTSISLLLGRSKSAISTARNKLYEKLQGKRGTPDMLDDLINRL